MFVYKRPKYYDSESEDSELGARCCAQNPCPEKDDQLSALTMKVVHLPPDWNELEDTFDTVNVASAENDINASQANAFQSIPPDQGSNLPYGLKTDGFQYKYRAYFGLPDNILDQIGYDATAVTVTFLVDEEPVPSSDIKVTKLLPEQLPWSWNLDDKFFLTDDTYHLEVNIPIETNPLTINYRWDITFTLSLIGRPWCPKYYISVGSAASRPEVTEQPTALYKIRAGPTYDDLGERNWLQQGVFTNIVDCDSVFGGPYVPIGYQDFNDDIFIDSDYAEIESKHFVNQAYWNQYHPGFTPTSLELRVLQKGDNGFGTIGVIPNYKFTVFKDCDVIPPSLGKHFTPLQPSGVPHVVDLTQVNNPTVITEAFPKSPDFDDNTTPDSLDKTGPNPVAVISTPKNHFFRWKWEVPPEEGLQQATIGVRYIWRNDTTGDEVSHYLTRRVMKGPRKIVPQTKSAEQNVIQQFQLDPLLKSLTIQDNVDGSTIDANNLLTTGPLEIGDNDKKIWGLQDIDGGDVPVEVQLKLNYFDTPVLRDYPNPSEALLSNTLYNPGASDFNVTNGQLTNDTNARSSISFNWQFNDMLATRRVNTDQNFPANTFPDGAVQTEFISYTYIHPDMPIPYISFAAGNQYVEALWVGPDGSTYNINLTNLPNAFGGALSTNFSSDLPAKRNWLLSTYGTKWQAITWRLRLRNGANESDTIVGFRNSESTKQRSDVDYKSPQSMWNRPVPPLQFTNPCNDNVSGIVTDGTGWFIGNGEESIFRLPKEQTGIMTNRGNCWNLLQQGALRVAFEVGKNKIICGGNTGSAVVQATRLTPYLFTPTGGTDISIGKTPGGQATVTKFSTFKLTIK